MDTTFKMYKNYNNQFRHDVLIFYTQGKSVEDTFNKEDEKFLLDGIFYHKKSKIEDEDHLFSRSAPFLEQTAEVQKDSHIIQRKTPLI